MKQSILFKIAIISLVFAVGIMLISSVRAASSSSPFAPTDRSVTLTGTVVDIAPASFVIQRSIPWYHFYYYFKRVFHVEKMNENNSALIGVTDQTVFLQKGGSSSNSGYTKVSFQDLHRKDKVVIKATQANGKEPNITPTFLPYTYEAEEVRIVVPTPRLPSPTNQSNVCFSNKTGRSMTIEEAESIAEKDCGNIGNINIEKEKGCNRITGTWWLGLEPKNPKDGCNPACVVNVDTKKAEVNWRCTGLIPSNNTHPFDIKGVVFRGDKVGVKGTIQVINCSSFEPYNIHTTIDTKYRSTSDNNLSQLKPGDIVEIKGQKINKKSIRPDYWEYTAVSVTKTGPGSFPGANGWSV